MSTSPATKDPGRQKKRLSAFSLHSTVLLFIISFRLLNALTIKTFFQPDEYFQALEPAWNIVFGDGWLTWEWRHSLRSILHPSIFALVYAAVDKLCTALTLSPETESKLLLVAPKLLQALFAAMQDWATARLAGTLWGSEVGWVALLLSTGSAWNWFCSTRTFSSSMETAVTAVALSVWPWTWASGGRGGGKERKELRAALVLAGVACLLRPTNVLIWGCLGGWAMWNNGERRGVMMFEATWIGATLLGLNALLDRWFYGQWTFPPLAFLHQNLTNSIAVFYGSNPWHYYVLQALPQLLTTFLPLALAAVYSALRKPSPASPTFQLASTVAAVTVLYSCVTHKEVRFLYPLLPLLHALAAKYYDRSTLLSPKTKKLVLMGMMAANVPLAYYTTLLHQRGVIDVLDHLRSTADSWDSVGFLMPCHSTPWTASLALPGVRKEMWALTCEPPVDVPVEERGGYVDEADAFYGDMKGFVEGLGERKGWPERLVMFEGAMEELGGVLVGGQRGYKECWRAWNSHWHDDGRRRGDVVVLCKAAE